MQTTKNAIINSVSIEIEDHGCLTIWMQLKFECYGQGFGGFALQLPEDYKHYSKKGVCGYYMYRCLQIAGVTKWKDLEGKTIRIVSENDIIIGIGHIINNDWFFPEKDMKD